MTCALSHLTDNLQADGNAVIQTLMQLSGGIGTSISAALLAFLQQGQALYDGTLRGSFYVLLFLTLMVIFVTLSQFLAFQGGKKNGF